MPPKEVADEHQEFPPLTVVTMALSAAALLTLSYEMGMFPGSFFEDAAIGPLPLWAVAFVLLLMTVCVGTVLKIVGGQGHD